MIKVNYSLMNTPNAKSLALYVSLSFIALLGALFYSLIDHEKHSQKYISIMQNNIEALNKLRLYSSLIEFSRTRIQLTIKILSSQDVFVKEELSQETEMYAGRFAQAYQELQQLPLSEFEKENLNRWEGIVKELLPAQREVVRLSIFGNEDDSERAIKLLFNEVMPKQHEAIKLFQEILSYYQLNTEKILSATERSLSTYSQKHHALLVFFILFCTTVAIFVVKRSYTIHKQLFLSHDSLEKQVDEKTRELKDTIIELNFQKMALDEHAIVSITDLQGRILYANEKFCDVSGYSRQELIGQDHRVINSGEHPQQFFSELWSTISHGKIWRGIIKNQKKDGSFYWVKSSIVPVVDENNKPLKYVAIRTEITDRIIFEDKLMQAKNEAELANKAKTEFLANMSHEIRTPMNAIMGFSELELFNTSLPEKTKNNLTRIHDSAKSLLVIINDILDLSKLESGKVVLEKVEFDLNQLLTETISIFKNEINNKGLAFNYSLDTNLPHCVMGDPTRLRQIIINMLDNAVKFTKEGQVFLECRKYEVSDHLQFSIGDTGIGMSEQQITTIFEPFVQADTSTTRMYGGTGLGTSISKRLVEAMEGKIWIESEPGKGSIFHFTVHLPEVEHCNPAGQ